MKEDTHFYIDSVPPMELVHVLRVLSIDASMTPAQIAKSMKLNYNFTMQRDHSYTPRRLFDIGLANQKRQGSSVSYQLTDRGSKMQDIADMDLAYSLDLIHYLHYSVYRGLPQDRKYLWSYRRCCEILWENMSAIPTSRLAAQLQAEMQEKFPYLDFTANVGARFDSSAVTRVYRWLRALEPSPLTDERDEQHLLPRTVERPELALLGLDDVYRNGGYTYGDPVLLDDELTRRVAGVFFLDVDCAANLLRISARMKPTVRLSETLAGVSITLSKPINFEEL